MNLSLVNQVLDVMEDNHEILGLSFPLMHFMLPAFISNMSCCLGMIGTYFVGVVVVVFVGGTDEFELCFIHLKSDYTYLSKSSSCKLAYSQFSYISFTGLEPIRSYELRAIESTKSPLTSDLSSITDHIFLIVDCMEVPYLPCAVFPKVFWTVANTLTGA
ncbi:hypothetical protein HAX54_046065 [Datura stramonium]|uniref:Uncharacterized protein n=1 Tax=Datura stramonium TaxID=4076 RepID=A0ABS8SQZ0_DATST|nr:hypothetical protein [Datura stramonium]